MGKVRFKPGQSGNPNGRPKGSRNKKTLALEALLEGEAEGLTRKCVELAKKGDTTALRLCMERIYPVRRGSPIEIDIPEINNSADIPLAISSVIRSVSSADISPEEGEVIVKLFDAERRAFETDELAQKVKALEEVMAR
ncbi:MAG: DUF5681 domain-containing protein [Emcibacteraceae bacterium]|nr:DUF5681 domain-containing protein [Emcibacteraceae bacterium]